MAIKGSLREASLPDVLQLLTLGKKSGCLSVTHRSNFGYIYFDKGRISYASIVNRRDRLGDLLVKTGAISQSQLDQAIDQQGRERDKKLGEIMVGMGLLAREGLVAHIRTQIEEAVYFLFTWTQGTFSFEPDVTPEQQDVLVSINPESLLLEGARRVDEWSLIEKKIPSFDLVFDVDRHKLREAAVKLTDEQNQLLLLVDGRRDVATLIEESGMVEFEVGKALYGLITAGFTQRVGKSRPTTDAVSEARVEEHRNLGIAFYKTGMLDEAVREFRRVIDLREGDVPARFYTGLVHLRQHHWSEAVRVLQEVAAAPGGARVAVFHNLAYALERSGRAHEAGLALDEALKRGGATDAMVQTTAGVVALRAGDAQGADATLASARPLWGRRPPPPAWFHYAALAAALSGDLQRGIALLTEGIGVHAHAAVLFSNLAAMLERKGQVDDAIKVAERGVMEDAGLPQLHKNVGDLQYRTAQYDEALESFQRAVKLAPDLGADVYLKLGNIRFRRQETAEAVKFWERSLELDPGNAIVRANLDAVRRGA
ncbi:MAG: DUF4388 domain-containing protein [Gemmatimonadetes bacterium]|nr:DUF4388 domain-containing protein [Gemmatimonadota bacterium]